MTEAPPPAISADELATRLAARMIHDFMSPASGIVSGLDLLEDPSAKDMQAEAMDLIAGSARKLVDLLTFSRAAFGAYAGSGAFDAGELETLALGVFAQVRPQLEWAVELAQVDRPAGRALLNLAQLAAGALAVGGVARVSVSRAGGRTVVTVDAVGSRARLHPEVAAGLAGEPVVSAGAGSRPTMCTPW
jgi:histidine phosphotransferase ChpT